ncbi:MAG: nucleoside-diphosphate kinase [Armatimonadetes bacterium]|nr:nucleoside-diphosphate kinase [Armatimonadota bacterium]
MERTFVMVKPDGVQRGLIGEIIRRFETRGLRLIGLKMLRIDEGLARRHYRDHIEKPFFPSLLEFITSSPVVAMVVEGKAAVQNVRTMMGALDPTQAQPGTLRGDYTNDKQLNIIHGSDSVENAEREIGLFFTPEEVLDYERTLDRWLVSP